MVAALAALAVVVPAPAGADHVPTHPAPPVWEGPFTVDPDWRTSSDAFWYSFMRGESAACGPDGLGDGWECPRPHRAHQVRYTARPPQLAGTYDRFTVQLYARWNSLVLLQEVSVACPHPWCNPQRIPAAAGDWVTWEGLNGGTLVARLVLNYRDATNTPRTWSANHFDLGHSFSPVVTAAERLNSTPSVGPLYFPDFENGYLDTGPNLHRRKAEHLQQFTGHFGDRDGHNISARLRVYGPGPAVACGSPPGPAVASYDWVKEKAAPRPPYPYDHAYYGEYPLGLTTPPLALPHANGTYTACLDAKDTSGWANAQSPTKAFTFTYTWNTAPTTPTQVVPNPSSDPDAAGKVFPAGVPVAFVAKALDPENDALTLITTINDQAKEYRSIPTSSGRETVTIIDDGLPLGGHYSEVAGEDIHGQRGAFDGEVSFQAIDPAAMSNQAPGTPTLVAPLENGTFPAGAPQDFTITATDPDRNRWRGVIQVQDREGVTVAEFATDETESGAAVSARPLVPIRPGTSYRWRATALDSRGALGPASDWRYFTVQGG